MPLPSALAARLARRGLIQVEEPKKVVPGTEDVEEEVFAEDYDNDDPIKDDRGDVKAVISEKLAEVDVQDEEEDDDPLVHKTYACPNKANKYHTCVDYCREKYGFKEFKHKENCDSKRERLLRRYPLPPEWIEVGDPDTGRYYYWHTVTTQVSWLPPSHPRSKVSLPAARIKESLSAVDINKLIENIGAEAMEVDKSKDEEAHNAEHDFEEIERELEREKRRNERKALRKKERESARGKAALDPMDPAAYSDIARGGWSEGLEQKGSSKTGVDTTANGPLFQQRPYPSPGAVLRANKQMEDDSSP